MNFRLLTLAAAGLSCLLACTGAESDGDDGQTDGRDIRIVLRANVVGLNPILSTLSQSRYVSEQIFQTLNATDPRSYELRPCLASLPVIDSSATGGMTYRYSLDSAAYWPNGQPILASDVIFSLKALLNPRVEANSYRHYYSMVSDVLVDPDDPRTFTVLTKRPYFLAAEAMADLYVYPEYVYDPEGLLRQIPLRALADTPNATKLVDREPALGDFADRFNDPSAGYDPERIIGSGPYRLTSWEAGRKIRLERRKDYWAENRHEPWLTARPEALTFLIVTDNTTTANILRDRRADIVVDMPIEQFKDLRDDAYLQQYFEFITVPGFKSYSILLNQENPLMADSLTRRALAYTVDVDQILEQLLPGLAERTVGPVLPAKTYYDDELPPIPFDVDEARKLLKAAGWEDTDGNGIVDREIDGERQDLSFTLLSYPSPTSEAVSLVVANGARAAGIDIRVVRQESQALLNQLNSGNFVASFYGLLSEPSPDDFSQVWSSTSVPPGGTNRANFRNSEADSLIDVIARTTDAERRAPLYRRFQRIVYDNQPMIFLFTPNDRLVVSKHLDYQVTSLAPNVHFNALLATPEPSPPL